MSNLTTTNKQQKTRYRPLDRYRGWTGKASKGKQGQADAPSQELTP